MDELTAHEMSLLAFERAWWKHAGSKEAAILEQLGLNPTRYYQLLGNLVDRPEALAADPMTVKRLRRIRDERVRGPLSLRARAR